MAGRTFIFDPPDRFVAGALGQPGQRTFFLQATKGSAVLSVGLEKVQVALLAERIGEILEAIGPDDSSGTAARRTAALALGGSGPGLREPVVEAFRVGSMSLAFDEERRAMVLEAREIGEAVEDGPGGAAPGADDDDAEDDPERHILRVRLSLDDARDFAEGALRVVAAGRPPCPICGEPLDPQGHICLRRNGYLM